MGDHDDEVKERGDKNGKTWGNFVAGVSSVLKSWKGVLWEKEGEKHTEDDCAQLFHDDGNSNHSHWFSHSPDMRW